MVENFVGQSYFKTKKLKVRGSNENSRKVRQGKINNYKNDLSKEDILFITKTIKNYEN